jgi:chromosome partitioning protein
MRIAVAGYKGGTAKTTTAVHLAAFFQESAPTLLIDGDPNRSASEWASAGALPFRVEDERKAARSGIARDFANVIVDSEARPAANDLRELAEGFELLILTSPPDALSLRALVKTIAAVSAVDGAAFKVLLTICPPAPSHAAEMARGDLKAAGVPVFRATIPRLAAFQRAALDGVIVRDVRSPRALAGWRAYQAAAKEIGRG